MKYYDPTHDRLIFVRQPATASYWDQHWQTADLKRQIERDSRDQFFTNLTRRFLPAKRSIRILEGGCGQGAVVLSLHRHSFDVYGIDYAQTTIKQVKSLYPHLKLFYGDLTKLPFPDSYFDGYWSLGVIEHDWNGYDAILAEIKRVLKPDGFLFLTHPYVSPLRRLKQKLNMYPTWKQPDGPPNFYQFALNYHQVAQKFIQHGFVVRSQFPRDAYKGLKDETENLANFWKYLNTHPSLLTRLIKAGINICGQPFTGHIMVNVLQLVRK